MKFDSVSEWIIVMYQSQYILLTKARETNIILEYEIHGYHNENETKHFVDRHSVNVWALT